ncbi:sulfite exporter TauE/SafE family protein [Aliidiomarina quisquiliarum]|uniref:sulfite exporter TauE/SafE family protein n=1 Tax=Aliidiomarina quisquiliarum TaxID=2938947 RepID=UPI00208E3F03|nr:sulfite exporter TauE/SafE family protein [Aliidiomarina quisquiliarum]MCO4320649.1 sulfite exporter TauE/SafE family protein [Aliidiomarina quisquiliarum]
MNVIDYWAALLMGIAGSGHCIAMCGGLAGAMGLQQSKTRIVLYNLGRITSYMIAGVLVGSAFFGLAQLQPSFLIWMRIAAGIMMVLLAAYLLRINVALLWLERLGAVLWRRLQPWSKKFNRNSQTSHIFAAGMLWGWLPCGLVYSALSWAALSASPVSGGFFMLLFGVGTLPSMLFLGMVSHRMQHLLKSAKFRWASSILLAGYGVTTIIIGLMQLR